MTSIMTHNLKVKDIADLFDYTEDHVRELARTNKIPHIKRGREYRFNQEAVSKALLKDPAEESTKVKDDSERGDGFEQPKEPVEDDYFDDIDLGI